MGDKMIQLTHKLQISNGGHILYSYESLNGYIENAASYIQAGVQQENYVIVIDTVDRFTRIRERLTGSLTAQEWSLIHFVDTYSYNQYKDSGYNYELIMSKFGELIKIYLLDNLQVRIWAHVEWEDINEIRAELEAYEKLGDQCICGTGIVSVCAYSSNVISASMLTRLLRHHEYWMTDEELVRSTLYQRKGEVIFPSLSVQAQLESEMDLYKQKLDFVHVVSHEVRNPLTVIKAYAKMVLDREQALSIDGVRKLRSIIDYVEVIDNEMGHIIHTEQMLSNDELWEKDIINPLAVLEEVVEMASIKSRIENINFICQIELQGYERLLNNRIGFKLIISNLLSNALKYTEEQGTVELYVKANPDRIYITIADEGVGMAEEQVHKLFRKYGKMNQEKSGQGIGLYMVKTLLDHFEGTIQVESIPQVGTTVFVEFPLVSLEKGAALG